MFFHVKQSKLNDYVRLCFFSVYKFQFEKSLNTASLMYVNDESEKFVSIFLSFIQIDLKNRKLKSHGRNQMGHFLFLFSEIQIWPFVEKSWKDENKGLLCDCKVIKSFLHESIL
jgi:hypothetical protein